MSHKQEVVEEGLVCIQSYIERSTSFIIQKAFALQLFATSVVNGIEVLEACVLAAKCSTFSSWTIRRWAGDVFGGYFFSISNIDDVSDEKLELEL